MVDSCYECVVYVFDSLNLTFACGIGVLVLNLLKRVLEPSVTC